MMEFALVAPILFALVFGIFDFGRCMSANVTVTNSAREGARWAATHTVEWSQPTTPGWPAAYQARFGFECPTGTPLTMPDSGPTQAAWVQAQAANLDLTKLTITVSYYASNNDPVNGGTADETESCSNGVAKDVGKDGVSAPTYPPQSGDWVRVEMTYAYSPATPLVSALLSQIKLDQTATMVLE